MTTRYIQISTNRGLIIAKEEETIQKVGCGDLSECKYKEYFTNEEFEFMDNYIRFTNLDKCIQYADIIVDESENFEIKPYSIKEITLEDIKSIEEFALRTNTSPIDLNYTRISKGVNKEEANRRTKIVASAKLNAIKNKLEELKRIKEEEQKYKYVTTFYNVFGDLFEEEEKKYRI